MHMKDVTRLSTQMDNSDTKSDMIVEDRNQLQIRLKETHEEVKKVRQKNEELTKENKDLVQNVMDLKTETEKQLAELRTENTCIKEKKCGYYEHFKGKTNKNGN